MLKAPRERPWDLAFCADLAWLAAVFGRVWPWLLQLLVKELADEHLTDADGCGFASGNFGDVGAGRGDGFVADGEGLGGGAGGGGVDTIEPPLGVEEFFDEKALEEGGGFGVIDEGLFAGMEQGFVFGTNDSVGTEFKFACRHLLPPDTRSSMGFWEKVLFWSWYWPV